MSFCQALARATSYLTTLWNKRTSSPSRIRKVDFISALNEPTKPPSTMPKFQHVFVTVGTTRFDTLTRTILTSKFLDLIASKGIKKLTIQYGKGDVQDSIHGLLSKDGRMRNKRTNEPSDDVTIIHKTPSGDLTLHLFPFSPCLTPFYSDSDMVISHAGSGSILEALDMGKALLVVINDSLMDNHQRELADALTDAGYLMSCVPSELADIIRENELEEMFKTTATWFDRASDGQKFVRLLDDLMYDDADNR